MFCFCVPSSRWSLGVSYYINAPTFGCSFLRSDSTYVLHETSSLRDDFRPFASKCGFMEVNLVLLLLLFWNVESRPQWWTQVGG